MKPSLVGPRPQSRQTSDAVRKTPVSRKRTRATSSTKRKIEESRPKTRHKSSTKQNNSASLVKRSGKGKGRRSKGKKRRRHRRRRHRRHKGPFRSAREAKQFRVRRFLWALQQGRAKALNARSMIRGRPMKPGVGMDRILRDLIPPKFRRAPYNRLRRRIRRFRLRRRRRQCAQRQKSVTKLELFRSDLTCMQTVIAKRLLQVVVLIGQPLRDLDGINLLPNLRELWAIECGLQDASAVEKCINLEKICLYRNELRSVPNLQRLQNLRTLWLAWNQISRVTNVDKLPKLQDLNLAQNGICTISQALTKCRSLKLLNLSGNPIWQLPEVKKLAALPCLSTLKFADILYGNCPVAKLCSYRPYIMFHIPKVRKIETVHISERERTKVRNFFASKHVFYHMVLRRIRCLHAMEMFRKLDQHCSSLENNRATGLRFVLRTFQGPSPGIPDDSVEVKKSIKGKIRGIQINVKREKDLLEQWLETHEIALRVKEKQVHMEYENAGNINFREVHAEDELMKMCQVVLHEHVCRHLWASSGIRRVEVKKVTQIFNKGLEVALNYARLIKNLKRCRLMMLAPKEGQYNMEKWPFEVFTDGFLDEMPGDVCLTNCLYYADEPWLRSLTHKGRLLVDKHIIEGKTRICVMVAVQPNARLRRICHQHKGAGLMKNRTVPNAQREAKKTYVKTAAKCFSYMYSRGQKMPCGAYTVINVCDILPVMAIEFRYSFDTSRELLRKRRGWSSQESMLPFRPCVYRVMNQELLTRACVESGCTSATLSRLSLTGCGIATVGRLPHMPSVTFVNLAFNKLISLAGLEVFPNLQELNVSHNNIESGAGLEPAHHHFLALQVLSLAWNNFTCFFEVVKTLGNVLPTLVSIDMRSNAVRDVRRETHCAFFAKKCLPQLNHYNGRELENVLCARPDTGFYGRTESYVNIPAYRTTVRWISEAMPPMKKRTFKSTKDIGPPPYWSSYKDLRLMNIKPTELLNQVKWFDCSKNFISSLDFLAIMPDVEELNLKCNVFSDDLDVPLIRDGENNLFQWANLTKLDLSCNYLRNVEMLQLILFPNLQIIDLSMNRIENLNGFETLKRLEECYVSCNNIPNKEALGALKHCPALRVLDLTGNPLYIDYVFRLFCFYFFRNLHCLNGEHFSEYDTENAERLYGGVMDYDYLLRDIERDELTNITQLSMTDCLIRRVNFTAGDLPNLKSLNLSKNCINALWGLHTLPQLQTLCLSYNNVTELFGDVGSVMALTKRLSTPRSPKTSEVERYNSNVHALVSPRGRIRPKGVLASPKKRNIAAGLNKKVHSPLPKMASPALKLTTRNKQLESRDIGVARTNVRGGRLGSARERIDPKRKQGENSNAKPSAYTCNARNRNTLMLKRPSKVNSTSTTSSPLKSNNPPSKPANPSTMRSHKTSRMSSEPSNTPNDPPSIPVLKTGGSSKPLPQGDRKSRIRRPSTPLTGVRGPIEKDGASNVELTAIPKELHSPSCILPTDLETLSRAESPSHPNTVCTSSSGNSSCNIDSPRKEDGECCTSNMHLSSSSKPTSPSSELKSSLNDSSAFTSQVSSLTQEAECPSDITSKTFPLSQENLTKRGIPSASGQRNLRSPPCKSGSKLTISLPPSAKPDSKVNLRQGGIPKISPRSVADGYNVTSNQGTSIMTPPKNQSSGPRATEIQGRATKTSQGSVADGTKVTSVHKSSIKTSPRYLTSGSRATQIQGCTTKASPRSMADGSNAASNQRSSIETSPRFLTPGHRANQSQGSPTKTPPGTKTLIKGGSSKNSPMPPATVCEAKSKQRGCTKTSTRSGAREDNVIPVQGISTKISPSSPTLGSKENPKQGASVKTSPRCEASKSKVSLKGENSTKISPRSGASKSKETANQGSFASTSLRSLTSGSTVTPNQGSSIKSSQRLAKSGSKDNPTHVSTLKSSPSSVLSVPKTTSHQGGSTRISPRSITSGSKVTQSQKSPVKTCPRCPTSSSKVIADRRGCTMVLPSSAEPGHNMKASQVDSTENSPGSVDSGSNVTLAQVNSKKSSPRSELYVSEEISAQESSTNTLPSSVTSEPEETPVEESVNDISPRSLTSGSKATKNQGKSTTSGSNVSRSQTKTMKTSPRSVTSGSNVTLTHGSSTKISPRSKAFGSNVTASHRSSTKTSPRLVTSESNIMPVCASSTNTSPRSPMFGSKPILNQGRPTKISARPATAGSRITPNRKSPNKSSYRPMSSGGVRRCQPKTPLTTEVSESKVTPNKGSPTNTSPRVLTPILVHNDGSSQKPPSARSGRRVTFDLDSNEEIPPNPRHYISKANSRPSSSTGSSIRSGNSGSNVMSKSGKVLEVSDKNPTGKFTKQGSPSKSATSKPLWRSRGPVTSKITPESSKAKGFLKSSSKASLASRSSLASTPRGRSEIGSEDLPIALDIPDVFFPALETLHLDHNGIQSAEPLLLRHMPRLKTLFFQHNALTGLKGLTDLKHLNHLIADHNKILGVVPKGFTGLRQLQELYLEYNSMKKLCFLKRLPQLKSLFLAHNNVCELDQLQCFKYLKEIQEMTFMGNPICRRAQYYYVVLSSTPSLQTLDGMALRHIREGISREIEDAIRNKDNPDYRRGPGKNGHALTPRRSRADAVKKHEQNAPNNTRVARPPWRFH